MKLIIILSGLILLSGCSPQIEYVEVPPETVTMTETITAPPADARTVFVPKIEYVDRVSYVEIPAEVEKIVTVNQTIEVIVCTDNLTKWRSQDEVRKYVKATGIPDRTYIKDEYDCDDFAIDLHLQALKDGYNIGLYALVNNEWQHTKGHLKNFVIIGNILYQIEPQTGNLNPMGGHNYALD